MNGPDAAVFAPTTCRDTYQSRLAAQEQRVAAVRADIVEVRPRMYARGTSASNDGNIIASDIGADSQDDDSQ